MVVVHVLSALTTPPSCALAVVPTGIAKVGYFTDVEGHDTYFNASVARSEVLEWGVDESGAPRLEVRCRAASLQLQCLGGMPPRVLLLLWHSRRSCVLCRAAAAGYHVRVRR